MGYDVLQKCYEVLSDEQQTIVYNLVTSLVNLNLKSHEIPKKRKFGKFVGKATVVFSDLWEMTEQELCTL